MPSLNWIGKEKIVNHDKEVPFRLLKKVEKYSLGKDSENLIIEGDNLEALKALMPYYVGQVKCIYIDPPYNTGNEGWVYNDRVNAPKIKEWLGKGVGSEGEDLTRHDKWLCMMYPRLKLLHDLLRDDGIIFVSIDDNEHCNLKHILDEIFGIENYVACITIGGNPRGRDYGGVARMHDYLLVYRKSEQTEINDLYDAEKIFPFKDKLGGFEIRELRNRNIAFHIGNRPNLHYAFYVNPKKIDSEGFFEISLEKQKGWVEVFPKESQGYKTVWRWGKPKSIENLNIEIVGKAMEAKGQYQIVEKYRKRTRMARSIWTDKDVNTEKGTLLLKEIFGNKVFAYPKPMEMIMRVIEMGSKDDNDIILDSFGGSGTTGHAVLEQNKKDGKNRKFILVEMEKDIAEKITSQRVRLADKKYNLDGHFSYEILSEPLFNANGIITEEVSYNEFAQYIYFTETHTNLNIKTITNPQIGEHNEIEYYLIYKKPKENLLDKSFLKNVKKNKNQKVVYADKCALSDKALEEYGIVFKQIPYEVKVY